MGNWPEVLRRLVLTRAAEADGEGLASLRPDQQALMGASMLAFDPVDSLTHDRLLALLRYLCDLALDSERMRGILQRERVTTLARPAHQAHPLGLLGLLAGLLASALASSWRTRVAPCGAGLDRHLLPSSHAACRPNGHVRCPPYRTRRRGRGRQARCSRGAGGAAQGAQGAAGQR